MNPAAPATQVAGSSKSACGKVIEIILIKDVPFISIFAIIIQKIIPFSNKFAIEVIPNRKEPKIIDKIMDPLRSINRNVVGSESMDRLDISNIGELIGLKEIANPIKKLTRYNSNENNNNNLLSKIAFLILLIMFKIIFSIIKIKISDRFPMVTNHTGTI